MVLFGIECISRGASYVYFCEKSHIASKMIRQNLEKTRLQENAEVINKDYRKSLQDFANNNIKFDIIFIDPPYKDNIAVDSVQMILSLKLLKEDGIIVIETDEKDRELENLKNLDIQVYDIRKL